MEVVGLWPAPKHPCAGYQGAGQLSAHGYAAKQNRIQHKSLQWPQFDVAGHVIPGVLPGYPFLNFQVGRSQRQVAGHQLQCLFQGSAAHDRRPQGAMQGELELPGEHDAKARFATLDDGAGNKLAGLGLADSYFR